MASSRFGCSDGFSLAGRMSDRRSTQRRRIGRVVQVAHHGEATYAHCRDFSDNGMQIDLAVPLELNDHVTVALSPSVVLGGRVVWVRGRECGIAFEGPIDSAALLEAVEPAPDAARCPTTLDLLGGRIDQPAHSDGRADQRFQAGLAVMVMVSPGFEQRGTVRWASGNIAALELTPDRETAKQALLPPPSS